MKKHRATKLSALLHFGGRVYDDVDWHRDTPEHTAETDHLGEPAVDGRKYDQQIEVAILVEVPTGIRAEQNNSVGVCSLDQPTRDLIKNGIHVCSGRMLDSLC